MRSFAVLALLAASASAFQIVLPATPRTLRSSSALQSCDSLSAMPQATTAGGDVTVVVDAADMDNGAPITAALLRPESGALLASGSSPVSAGKAGLTLHAPEGVSSAILWVDAGEESRCVSLSIEQAPVAAAAPLEAFGHASCALQWTFEASCSDVSAALVAAANKMGMSADCGSSEKCLYNVVSSNSTNVVMTHETPKAHYVDDVTMALVESGDSCVVQGHSQSRAFSILDYGTNYCNLHNVGSVTGLKFTEDVDKSHCTQYSSANCDKY